MAGFEAGPGIAPDRLGRVFKLFYTIKATGTGLGLAVTKKIIEMHGGTISVASEPGKGAAATIELPRPGASPRSDKQDA